MYRYIGEWHKNPHCSFSCCLALLLPLNDLQSDIHGLSKANVFKDQLQIGQIEMSSIEVTCKGGDDRLEAQSENCQDAKCNAKT